jgi:hypothetical protein
MAVKRGDHGPVRIEAGKFAGLVGDYDDDFCELGHGVVYLGQELGQPFDGPHVVVPLKWLRRISVEEYDAIRSHRH